MLYINIIHFYITIITLINKLSYGLDDDLNKTGGRPHDGYCKCKRHGYMLILIINTL